MFPSTGHHCRLEMNGWVFFISYVIRSYVRDYKTNLDGKVEMPLREIVGEFQEEQDQFSF